jgi:hypothetical protein
MKKLLSMIKSMKATYRGSKLHQAILQPTSNSNSGEFWSNLIWVESTDHEGEAILYAWDIHIGESENCIL